MTNPPKHLTAIIRFYQKHRRLPSYREILKLAGFKSTNAAHKLANKLIALGFLAKDNGRLVPGRKFRQLPILGTVQAGWPSPAEEELVDTMNLDEWLVTNREATYILKASGDSMLGAGINPGDMLLVERGLEPKNGDIVVAEVDKQWTLKYFKRQGAKVVLEAANSKYPVIIPEEELKIAAVVTAVIRKYK